MAIEFYTILTLLIVFTALFSYINYRFFSLPPTIGVMVISLVCSILLVLSSSFIPGVRDYAVSVITSINFAKLLMEVMLSFLLFAGAIHVDLQKLRQEKGPILIMATLGVLMSTTIIGGIMYFVFGFFNMQINFIYCLLFGALISPTDPIAVMGILKNAKIPPALETKITGESLFNDGVGVVLFLILVQIASRGLDNMSGGDIALLFLVEAGGGIIWGLILGFGGFMLLRSIDNYQIEVLITLAMVMGGYALANMLHISGPLAMVVAGIIIGNRGQQFAMSDVTKDYLNKFWELIDEILNALLFLLIGLEILIIPTEGNILYIAAIAIVIVLFARWVAVVIPISLLSLRRKFLKGSVAMLTWGGLRGGISVALALSIPEGMHRSELLTITYTIVIFSIIVQGLTIGQVAKRIRNA